MAPLSSSQWGIQMSTLVFHSRFRRNLRTKWVGWPCPAEFGTLRLQNTEQVAAKQVASWTLPGTVRNPLSIIMNAYECT
jgi:hypothetical protein